MFLALLLACTTSARSASPQSRNAPAARALQSGEVRLTYLGNAGWEITDRRQIILVDPFLTQFARWTPSGSTSGPAPDAPYPADTALINKHIQFGGHEILIMGSMNFIEREMDGLRPDIALEATHSAATMTS